MTHYCECGHRKQDHVKRKWKCKVCDCKVYSLNTLIKTLRYKNERRTNKQSQGKAL